MKEITERQLNNKLKKLMQMKVEKSILEESIKAIENEIKDFMDDVQEFETNKYVIKWSKFEKEIFDQDRFKKQNGAIYQSYLKKVETRRFSVACKKDNAA